MSRRGDNIHKRSDGRWEGRYISGRNECGKAVYRSVYARTYADCSEKLKLARCNLLPVSKPMTVDELFSEWLLSRKNKVKQSTYVNYLTLSSDLCPLSPSVDKLPEAQAQEAIQSIVVRV